MNTHTPFYVISAERAELTSQENGDRSNWMGVLLRDAGYTFEAALGSYEGIQERSFIVFVPAMVVPWDQTPMQYTTVTARRQIQRLARLFNQDSYIHVDANRLATLYDKNGIRVRELGQWHELLTVTQRTVARAWTQTSDGRYWSAA